MESVGTDGAARSTGPRRRVHRVLAAAVATLAVLLAPSAPAAAQYGGTQGFVIDPPVVNTGGTVAFLGTGCENESTVTFVVEPLDLELGETSPVDGGDFYLADVVITLEPGVYPVTAVCGDTSMVAELTVLAEGEGLAYVDTDGDGIPDALAFTGSGTAIVKTGLALGAAGLVLLVAARRRDDEEETAPVS